MRIGSSLRLLVLFYCILPQYSILICFENNLSFKYSIGHVIRHKQSIATLMLHESAIWPHTKTPLLIVWYFTYEKNSTFSTYILYFIIQPALIRCVNDLYIPTQAYPYGNSHPKGSNNDLGKSKKENSPPHHYRPHNTLFVYTMQLVG